MTASFAAPVDDLSVVEPPVLEVRDLQLSTRGPDGRRVALVDGVSFEVRRGESFCLVGESGSGKSLTMLAVMGLLPPGVELTCGTIRLHGRDITGWGDQRMQPLRGKELAMIFQDPMTALNPLRRVGRQIDDTLRIHTPELDRATRAQKVVDLLTAVGVPRAAERARSFPHQWSGGMRQRAIIAMAIALDPDLMIADEPTTALDVTIQAQVVNVLSQARRRTGSGLILITHDLGLVAGVADRVAIMYSGKIVETGSVHEIFARPRHPYTAGLLASILTIDAERAAAIPGSPPLAAKRPAGCAFAPRCPKATDLCRTTTPVLVDHDGHEIACHHPVELDTRSLTGLGSDPNPELAPHASGPPAEGWR